MYNSIIRFNSLTSADVRAAQITYQGGKSLKRPAIALLITLLWATQAFGLELSGRLRYRAELFQNYNKYEKLRSTEDSDELLHFTRLDVKAHHTLPCGTELFSEVRGSMAGGNGNVETAFKPDDTARVHQGYILLHNALGKNLDITLGRQEMRFGRELLVGADDWDNIGRSFDGIRMTGRKNDWTVDAFASRVTNPSTPFSDGTFSGVNVKHEDEFRTVREFYVYHRSIPNIDAARSVNFQLVNVGARTEGKISDRVFYEFMGNMQFGKHTQYEPAFVAGTRHNHRAHNYLAHLDYYIDGRILRNAGVEYSSSTGDDGNSGEKHETFMPLFPSDHARFGAMDWFGLMNADITTVYTFYDVTSDVSGLVELHSFRLQSPGSSWYLGNLQPAWWNAANKNSPGDEDAPRDAGTEIDLSWRIRARDNLTYHIGYSVFYPGRLFKDPRWWNTSEKAQWAYFQVQADF